MKGLTIFFLIALTVLAALTLLVQVRILFSYKRINRRLNEIMGNQQQFDEKVAEINTKLDTIGEQITAEAQQIRDFIEANPGVDTSALDGVVTRLDGLNVAGIFEPPTVEG